LAEETRIGKILVPAWPGTLCALGALMTDVRSDYIKTVREDVASVNVEVIRNAYRELEQVALEWVRAQGSIIQRHGVFLSVDMRYRGEPYDIEVVLPRDTAIDQVTPGMLADLFHTTHQQVYNFMDREAAVRITNLRVRVSGEPRLPAPRELPRAEGPAIPVGERRLYYHGEWHRAAVYERSQLMAGHQLNGAAVIEQLDTTTLVPPGFVATVDRYGILTVAVGEPAAATSGAGATGVLR
jgi:N-methylhydantoinase A